MGATKSGIGPFEGLDHASQPRARAADPGGSPSRPRPPPATNILPARLRPSLREEGQRRLRRSDCCATRQSEADRQSGPASGTIGNSAPPDPGLGLGLSPERRRTPLRPTQGSDSGSVPENGELRSARPRVRTRAQPRKTTNSASPDPRARTQPWPQPTVSASPDPWARTRPRPRKTDSTSTSEEPPHRPT
jgi:hypothetical protein